VERLMKIDRRIIYLIGAAIVFLTMFYPLGLPVKVSPLVESTYDLIDSLPSGSLVWIAPQYDAGAMGELNPMFAATFRHCVEKGYRIIVGNVNWVQGPQLCHPIATDIAEEYGYVYGEDWINLGSKPGGGVWLQSALDDLWNAAKTDFTNQPVTSFTIMQDVPKLTADYIDMLIVLECGSPGAADCWLPYIAQGEGMPMVVGEIQMSVPENMPYVDSGQFAGFIAGSRGCAEYEQLVGAPGEALKGQDTMSAIALMVTLFIILGNIGYLARKK